MGFSRYPTITDELLSAYIDNAVSAAERAVVEEAAANDSEIAWRLESLQRTVSMLGQLTDVPLPRSFTLDAALVEIASTENHAIVHPRSVETPPSLWDRWLNFWRSGSPVWRNAAAACALLLVMVLVSGSALLQQPASYQSGEFVAVGATERQDSLEQGTRMSAPEITDTESDAASARVAMAPESAAVATDQAGSDKVVFDDSPGETEALSMDSTQEVDGVEGDSATAESQIERSLDVDPPTAVLTLQEAPSANLEPLAAPVELSSESVIADADPAADPTAVPDPDAPEPDVPDADQLIVASALEMRATLSPQEEAADEEAEQATEDDVEEYAVEETTETEIAEPLLAQPSDREAGPAEALSDAVTPIAVDRAQQDDMRSIQPSTVAMADSAQDAEPASEAVTEAETEAMSQEVLEERSESSQASQSDPEKAIEQPLPQSGIYGMNSIGPLAMLTIGLAMLTLVFFAMWLRSRATTPPISSSD